MRRKGLTLIELLIVVAVVNILTAIVLQTFAKSRETARQSACASNLRKIGVAIASYTQDYNQCLTPCRVLVRPPVPSSMVLGRDYIIDLCARPVAFWINLLAPYVNSAEVFKCPSGVVGVNCRIPIKRSYNMNATLVGCCAGAIKLATITKPSNTIISADCGAHEIFGDNYPTYYYDDSTFSGWPWVANRHNMGANLLWVDGHVTWHQRGFITPTMLHASQ